jgi:hypothetical protein
VRCVPSGQALTLVSPKQLWDRTKPKSAKKHADAGKSTTGQIPDPAGSCREAESPETKKHNENGPQEAPGPVKVHHSVNPGVGPEPHLNP